MFSVRVPVFLNSSPHEGFRWLEVYDPQSVKLAYAKTKFYPGENKSVTKSLFILELDHIPAVTLSWEHASYEWVSLDTLAHEVELRPFYKEAVSYCFSNGLV